MKDPIKKIRYAIGLVRLLKNWPEVLGRFVTRSNREGYFRFRNGLVMRYVQWVEIEEVIGTFVRHDYGSVPPGATVVDIGASLGSFSLLSAQSGARVWAFEPAPASFAILSQNIQLNGWRDRIAPSSRCVGGKAGKRDFFISQLSPLSSFYAGKGEKITVDCTTLADIFEEHQLARLDILKLDCEGAEYEILYCTPPQILEKIGEIRLEYHVIPEKRANPEALTEFLLRHGFALVHRRVDAPISGILRFKRLQSA